MRSYSRGLSPSRRNSPPSSVCARALVCVEYMIQAPPLARATMLIAATAASLTAAWVSASTTLPVNTRAWPMRSTTSPLGGSATFSGAAITNPLRRANR